MPSRFHPSDGQVGKLLAGPAGLGQGRRGKTRSIVCRNQSQVAQVLKPALIALRKNLQPFLKNNLALAPRPLCL
jgi:hypothetical protein